MNENEALTVTLTLDNDEELECAVLTIYEVDGQEYIALLPIEEEDNDDDDEGEVFLYRYTEKEEGQPELENIEDDDEYERAADKFDEWLDAQDFEDMDDEPEEV